MSQSRKAEELKRFVQNTRKVNGQTLDNDVQIDNVASADKLKTARTISLSGAVTSMPTAFDGSNNINIPIEKVYQGSLEWGGANRAGRITPLGASLCNEANANRLAFVNPNAITIEYSTDGGVNWRDSGINDITKVRLCTMSTSVSVGDTLPVTLNHQTRITIKGRDLENNYFYNTVEKILIDTFTPHELKVKVETQRGNSEAWEEYGSYQVYGFGGWNDLPIMLNTLGGDITQKINFWRIRLTFITVKVNADYPSRGGLIRRIRMFGAEQWTAPSNYSKTGHIYDFDEAQNVTFPKNLSISGNTLKIGNTTLTETQLQALLNLLTT